MRPAYCQDQLTKVKHETDTYLLLTTELIAGVKLKQDHANLLAKINGCFNVAKKKTF